MIPYFYLIQCHHHCHHKCIINSNHHNQDTEPNTPTTLTKVIDVPDEKETSLLSLLSQGFTSNLMDDLDTCESNAIGKNQTHNEQSIHNIQSPSLATTAASPSSSSLLNLLDDNYDTTNINIEEIESTNMASSQLSSGHGDYDDSDSLLNLLDSDDFDSIESRKGPSSNYQSNTTTTTTTRNNDSLMSMFDDIESSSSMSSP